jgi:hypothetical protein
MSAWVAKYVLLEDLEGAEYYLGTIVALLVTLAFIQLKAFSRPPPVPLKRLPKRPAVQLLFKPDEPAAASTFPSSTAPKRGGPPPRDAAVGHQRHASPWKRGLGNVSVASVTRLFSSRSNGEDEENRVPPPPEGDYEDGFVPDDGIGMPIETVGFDDEDEEGKALGTEATRSTTISPTEATDAPFVRAQDLPDSFAPLLSSSQMEVLRHQLTADLLHAVHAQAGAKLRPGRHEIPLDKDASRPQLIFTVPPSGCKVSAAAVVGSDGFDAERDLDVSIKTVDRSRAMVKHAGLVLDPPLPLSNVAPTLIHFPTLFEDRYFLPSLRRIQIVRFAVDFIVSISSFLEKCLWILESKCAIHLSKIRITPLYKGSDKQSLEQDGVRSPDWRLSLSFSGHLQVFGFLPVPFISVTLPTFIIPQPHALLENLLSSQPLASARIRREHIAEERIALALINMADSWNADVKVVATPPALGVDVTLSGGVSVAMELGLWRDYQAGQNRESGDPHYVSPATARTSSVLLQSFPLETASINSMSSWTTHHETTSSPKLRQRSTNVSSNIPPFDANNLVPWSLEFSAKGYVSHEKMSVHVKKAEARHEDPTTGVPITNKLAVRGSFAVWKYRPEKKRSSPDASRLRKRIGHRAGSNSHPELEAEDSPSVAAILLFHDETLSFHSDMRMLQYDYAFDVFDDARLDAITVSVGATHPMLNGGTMVTAILDSIYAFGSFSAREDSVLDPNERSRKRNFLRHLPAIDFTFGIQNIFIPIESSSYSDDGQTLFLPEVDGGRMMVRFLGGMEHPETNSLGSTPSVPEIVTEGVKLVADFEIASLLLRSEGFVKEFPELSIFEGDMLRSLLSGMISGTVKAHLRPQEMTTTLSTTGPNIYNPLEAYEIDFSGSSLTVKMKECSFTLGHRRIMFPAESTFVANVVESIADSKFGRPICTLTMAFFSDERSIVLPRLVSFSRRYSSSFFQWVLRA